MVRSFHMLEVAVPNTSAGVAIALTGATFPRNYYFVLTEVHVKLCEIVIRTAFSLPINNVRPMLHKEFTT